MTRENFINELGKELQHASIAEREEAINYYLEYFEDRGIAPKDEVPADIAAPRTIAQEILMNIPYSQTQAANQAEYNLLPMSVVESLEIRLKIAGFELEWADIPNPELKLPYTKEGRGMNYKIDFSIQGTHLRIIDEAPSDLFSKWNRFNVDPVVLRLPRKTRLKNAYIDLSMGSTKLYGMTAEKLELRNAMGAVKLIGGLIEYMDAELKMGSFQLDRADINGSHIRVSMGDLRGKAKLLGSHQISCEMGSIRLDLQQSQADTHYQTEVTLGSFRINGEAGGQSNLSYNPNPSAQLRLAVNMGSIKLNFLEKSH